MVNSLPDKHHTDSDVVASKKDNVRDLVLHSAGLSPDVLAALLGKAVAVLTDKLEAKDTKFFSYQGEVIMTRDVDAHSI